MDQVLEFRKLYYKASGNAVNTLKDRKASLLSQQRAKRSTILFTNRRIDPNMSPYRSPAPSKSVIKEVPKITSKMPPPQPKPGVLNRLDMLAKWKLERAKKKEMEKANQKPIFKVCHVNSHSNVDLENVNKLIKGKPFKYTSKFAPVGHEFKAPTGVEPLSLAKSNLNPKGKLIEKQSNVNKSKTPKKIAEKKVESKSFELLGPSKKTNINRHFKNNATKDAVVQTQKSNDIANKPQTNKKNEVLQSKKLTEMGVKKQQTPKKIDRKVLVDREEKSLGKTPENPKMEENNKIETLELSKTTPTTHNIKNTATKDVVEAPKAIDKVVEQEEPQTNTIDNTDGSNAVEMTPSKRKSKRKPAELSVKKQKTPKNTDRKVLVDREEKSLGKTPENRKMEENNKIETLELSKTTPTTHNIKNTATKDVVEAPKTIDKVVKQEEPHNNTIIDNTDGSNALEMSPNKRKSKNKPAELNVKKQKTPKKTERTLEEEVTNTPEKPINSPMYISPFVTLSRGKEQARQEYKDRQSTNPDLVTRPYTSPRSGAKYFNFKLNSEIERLTEMYQKWELILDDPELPEEAVSSISVTIGQSKLLIAEKFRQFRGLIEQCMTLNFKEKSISCRDLHGFWDMVYMQVENLDQRFGNLERLKESNWIEMLPEKEIVVVQKKKSKKTTKKPEASSKLKDMIKAAREKQKTGTSVPVPEEVNTSVNTPVKVERRSLRRSSVYINQKRCSTCSSPGLVMMKVSQSIKQGNGLTPQRSILKTPGFKSTGKKSVAFNEHNSSPKRSLVATALFKSEQKTSRKTICLGESEKENKPKLRRSARLANRSSLV